jgi:5-methylcytosine-specific restriction enzyme A
MPSRPRVRCPKCKRLHNGRGQCDQCRAAADRARGTAAQRGYDREHETRFRAGVLERDPYCVLCLEWGITTPATVADHYPLSRRQLVKRKLDPNDPQYGRGLCDSCHGRETQRHQPGGWNKR